MNYIDAIHRTREGPGVLAVGKNQEGQQDVFVELSDLLSDFVAAQNLFLYRGEVEFRHGNRVRYTMEVYNPEEVQISFEHVRDLDNPGVIKNVRVQTTPPPVRGTLAVISLPPRRVQRYVRDWDFPHAPHEETRYGFLTYFNMQPQRGDNIPGSMEMRDSFLEYTAKRG